jgi:hypothetical protein
MVKIDKFTIYGERCSGTNYLEEVIIKNFDVNLTYEFGFKHFFGFTDNLDKSDNTLFICIVRNINDWINSFYRDMHHLPLKYIKNISEEQKIYKFLNDEIWSFDDRNNNRDTSKEIMHDRNIYTHQRYKNIFELRNTKLQYMIEDLPKKVKNYIFIKYEDLIDNFEEIIEKIKNCGMKIREDIHFPTNIIHYKKNTNLNYINIKKTRQNKIDISKIIYNKNFIPYYESKLGYLKMDYIY